MDDIHPPDNIFEQFQLVANAYPSFPAIVSEQSRVSYAELYLIAAAFAETMLRHGVDNSAIVALNSGDTLASLASLLATSAIGCRFVVASNALAREKLIEPTHFFKTADAAGKPGVPFVTIDDSWLPHPGFDPHVVSHGIAEHRDTDVPWLLLQTSGTTGRPKTLPLSQSVVSRRTRAVAEDFPVAKTTMASLFGNTSRPFYARALGALLHAGTIVDSYDIKFWRLNGVNVVFGSPRQAEQFFAERVLEPRLPKIEVSGAKLTDELAQILSRSFTTIIDVYGASETNKSFANFITVGPGGAVRRTGKPGDSVIEILGGNGQLCPPGTEGTLRVRNGYLAPGYLGAPELTAKSFVDGWFYPGDFAMFGENGELIVTGRTDDVLSFGGFKLDAVIVEWIVRNTPGVLDVVCFKNPREGAKNELVAYVVFEELVDRRDCVAAIRENYDKKLNLPFVLGPIHGVDRVPYNEEGKPMRALCQQMLLDRVKEIESVY